MSIRISQRIYNRRDKALEVYTIMFHKANVLNCDYGILEHVGYFVNRRPVPVFHVGKRGYYIAVLIVNIRCKIGV